LSFYFSNGIQETEEKKSGNRGEEFRKKRGRIRKVKFCVAIS
jgi:hypothetical protein